MESSTDILKQYIRQQKLPEQYHAFAQKWFTPLAESLFLHQTNAGKPILVGINGTQGSGKSTLTGLLTEWLTKVYNKPSIGISIDDYYLTKQKREVLAETVHPLLKTRGVPGTHDTQLMVNTLTALLNQQPCHLPVFDKATDDVLPKKDWRNVQSKYDVIILEGWCVGVSAQASDMLDTCVNELESKEDTNHIWRNFVNDALTHHYAPIYDLLSHLVMLKAPSFDCVLQWRCEQEHKLIEKLTAQNLPLGDTMSDQEVFNFIQLYQRLTEHSLLTLPSQADYLFELDTNRGIQSCRTL